MISCRLKGGLGNLMFQIAAIEYMAKSKGFQRGYWNTDTVLNSLNNGHISSSKGKRGDVIDKVMIMLNIMVIFNLNNIFLIGNLF